MFSGYKQSIPSHATSLAFRASEISIHMIMVQQKHLKQILNKMLLCTGNLLRSRGRVTTASYSAKSCYKKPRSSFMSTDY